MDSLPESFFTRHDTLKIAKELLGKILITEFGSGKTVGRIVETEAYLGAEDKACHAFGNRRTPRTEPMFLPGGNSYVYLIYGIHPMFNIVTHSAGVPHVVLVRGLEPLEGISIMLDRRKKKSLDYTLTSGPGSLAKAMGIQVDHSGISLLQPPVWLASVEEDLAENDILSSPRVGIDYAGADALLPYRFRIRGSSWTSPAK